MQNNNVTRIRVDYEPSTRLRLARLRGRKKAISMATRTKDAIKTYGAGVRLSVMVLVCYHVALWVIDMVE